MEKFSKDTWDLRTKPTSHQSHRADAL